MRLAWRFWYLARRRQLAAWIGGREQADRGDVPGWVLITLMTAGLVMALWGLAQQRFTAVFNQALDQLLGS